jgi:tetratricopeptide (TPR) repeat protein
MTFWRLWRRRPPPNEPSERTPEPATPSGRRWDARFSTRLLPRIERLLAEAEREFGPDHPDTVIFRSNLARAYAGAGDLDRAIPLFERILADRERLLGPDHPDTLAARNDLAEAYRAAGDLDRAIPLLERTLADTERVLGDDHRITETARSRLSAAKDAARKGGSQDD